MSEHVTLPPSPPPAAVPVATPVRRKPKRKSRIWQKTTMRRAMIEGLLIFLAAQSVAMVPVNVWPPLLFPVVLIARTLLFVLPPVWAASRVVSTKREKMSRRFWKLGPLLALYCSVVACILALAVGETTLWGGLAGPPDLVRFGMAGAHHLAPQHFVVGTLTQAVELVLYYTIAVVCTRLANGGFMRFTMPAGNGRVTL